MIFCFLPFYFYILCLYFFLSSRFLICVMGGCGKDPPKASHTLFYPFQDHSQAYEVTRPSEAKLPNLFHQILMMVFGKVERRKWKSRRLICGFGGFLSAHTIGGKIDASLEVLILSLLMTNCGMLSHMRMSLWLKPI